MARSLPENTVDAWTSIELARCGAPWIWLPTTNQGASTGGTHPGDVSSLLGRRLILIENKGIEAEKSIAFGHSSSRQRNYLTAIEDLGLSLLGPSGRPWLGWVFYGLPLREGAVYGADWRSFPDWQHLVCPHTLDQWGVGTSSATIGVLRSNLVSGATCHCSISCSPGCMSSIPFTLGSLAYLAGIGLAGLPLAHDESSLFGQVRDLVDGARAASLEIADVNVQSQDADSVLELLQELASIVGGRGHNRVVGIV